jgi:hypothetical protein
MKLFRLNPWFPIAWLLLGLHAAAQWSTQTISLVTGWNAVYLHVDVTNQALDSWVGSDPLNPIAEIWEWIPSSGTIQFIQDPSIPVGTNTHWVAWNRNGTPGTGLQYLRGNAAYLVRATTNYTWGILGQPVAPRYLWTGTGLNFIGFPTPSNQPPTFDTFLSPVPDFAINAEIFNYPGGPLGPANPAPVLDLTTQPVTRGQAFWLRAPQFNKYYGAISVDLGSASRINFRDNLQQSSFRLINSTSTNLSVTLTLMDSDSPPPGQTPIAGTPPLLLRGPVNLTNLTYSYQSLSAPFMLTLSPAGQPGSDVEVVLGLNRSTMSAYDPGTQFAGILRITDSLGYSQLDVPVSAQAGCTVGLYVGSALINQLQQYLTEYITAADLPTLSNILAQLNLTNSDAVSYVIDPDNNRVRRQARVNGGLQVTYLTRDVSQTNTSVAAPYPIRLILHNAYGTNVTLLQRVYVGMDVSSNSIVAVRQSLIDPARLSSAHRISSVHFPWSPESSNLGWNAQSGALAIGQTLRFIVPVEADNFASNPFLHTYHPDHDNLDERFQNAAPAGTESYRVVRSISLQVNPPGDGFDAIVAAASRMSGIYHETITVSGVPGQARSFDIGGYFSLNLISPVPTLTRN